MWFRHIYEMLSLPESVKLHYYLAHYDAILRCPPVPARHGSTVDMSLRACHNSCLSYVKLSLAVLLESP